MLGGFYIEMVVFKVFGNWFDGSGWMSVIVDVGVIFMGVVDFFIKVFYFI